MRLRVAAALFRKEVTDISRDSRTLVISILIPLILFPLSFFAMNVNIKKTARSLESGIPVCVDVKDSGIRSCITGSGRISVTCSDDPLAELAAGNIAAVIDEPPVPCAEQKTIRITCDNTSQYSAAAGDLLQGMITNCAVSASPVKPGSVPVNITRTSITEQEFSAGIILLQVLLPMLMLVFSATAPMAVAADLFAGEKERGTLEHLLCLPLSPAEIITGKFLAALCAGITGVVSFMTGIALSYIISPDVFGSAAVTVRVSASSALVIAVFSILIIATFTAVEFVLSLFSRSAREAQVLFIPVVVIAMACGHTITMVDVKRISLIYRHVPLVNSGLVLKEAVTEIFNISFISIAAVWCAGLVLSCLAFCVYMLSREKYIFRT